MSPDERIEKFIEGFSRIQEAQTDTKIGPYAMSQLMPCFAEDYFLYWGTLKSVRDESYVIRWIVPRTTLFATVDQVCSPFGPLLLESTPESWKFTSLVPTKK